MKISLHFALSAALCVCCLPAFADSITTTAAQTGTKTNLNGLGSGVVFTAGDGYDFAGTNYLAFSGLDTVSVTLTINDGDTAPGDYDVNNLSLTLDGIDTGLKLNGFLNDQTVQLTLGGPVGNAADVLAALKADGKLVGGITTSQGGDTNVFLFPTIDTSLTLTGPVAAAAVPEPGTYATAAVLFGGLALGLLRGRRK